MRVIIAKKAGFCMGVRRAVNMALDLSNNEDGPIFTLGPLIHNPQVVDILSHKGIKPLKEDRDNPIIFKDDENKWLLIRAHGVPPDIINKYKNEGYEIVDGTCPKVIAVQKIIERAASEGSTIVIVGDHGHPEVIGLQGHARGKSLVISDESEIDNIPDGKIIIVSQTTNEIDKFRKICKAIEKKNNNVKSFETICNSTFVRQEEVRRLAAEVEAIVIVGGHNSGNTKRLKEVAKEMGIDAFLVETEKELESEQIKKYSTVGITAGASTPNWMINRVISEIYRIAEEDKPLYHRFIKTILRFLSHSHILLASSAGALSFALQFLLNISPPSRRFAAISFLYIFSMHLLHRFMDRDSLSLNEPEKSVFLHKYNFLFYSLSAISLMASIYFAFAIDMIAGIILFAASLFGLIYRLKILPVPGKKGFKFKSIENIPASKTMFISLAWATVLVLLPVMAKNSPLFTLINALIFFLAIISVFIRQLFFDLRDVQGDRVVGRETLPIVFGSKIAENILKISPVFGFFFVFTVTFAQDKMLYIPIFLPLIFAGWLYIWLYNKATISDFSKELMVDGVFIITGLLTLISLFFCS